MFISNPHISSKATFRYKAASRQSETKAARGIFAAFGNGGTDKMDYMTISQAAEKWGVSHRRVQTLISEGRIKGAVRFGFLWAIPSKTEKPKDARIKSGKYIKNEKQ